MKRRGSSGDGSIFGRASIHAGKIPEVELQVEFKSTVGGAMAGDSLMGPQLTVNGP